MESLHGRVEAIIAAMKGLNQMSSGVHKPFVHILYAWNVISLINLMHEDVCTVIRNAPDYAYAETPRGRKVSVITNG